MTKSVSPEEWAGALEDARNTLELWDAGLIIESDYLCARALLAGKRRIEKLEAVLRDHANLYCEGWCEENGGYFDDCSGCPARAEVERPQAPDDTQSELSRIRTLAEGMAGALEEIELSIVESAYFSALQTTRAALAAYRKQDDETEGK